jgi:acyl carrier protein
MEQLVTLISTYLEMPREDIKADTNIRDLAGDSLDLIEIILMIEDQFRIDIPDEAIDTMVTVQDMHDFISSNTITQQSSAV